MRGPLRQQKEVALRVAQGTIVRLQHAAKSLRTSLHLEVINQRIRERGEESCRDHFVRRMVEVRAQAVAIVKFEHSGVRKISMNHVLIGAADADASSDARAPDRGNLPKRCCPDFYQLAAIRHGDVRTETEQHNVSDQRCGPFGNLTRD